MGSRPLHQWRWRSECRPSLSVISAAFIALGKSCLLANTSSTASRSSSCANTEHATAFTAQATYRAARLAAWPIPKPCESNLDTHRRAFTHGKGAGSRQTNLVQHPVQLVASLADAVAVVAVHHEDETLRILEVVPPQGPDLRVGTGSACRLESGQHICSTQPQLRRAEHTLSWPPTSHTVKLMFLYSTVSTLKPAERCSPKLTNLKELISRISSRAVQTLQCSTPAHAAATSRRRNNVCGLPMVGMVVTISPSFSLYRMVVLPAASRPTCRQQLVSGASLTHIKRQDGLACSMPGAP